MAEKQEATSFLGPRERDLLESILHSVTIQSADTHALIDVIAAEVEANEQANIHALIGVSDAVQEVMLRLDEAAQQLEDMEQQLMGYKDTMKVMNTALQEIEETNLAMSLQSRNQTQIMDELTGVMRKITLTAEYTAALEKPRFITTEGVRKTTEAMQTLQSLLDMDLPPWMRSMAAVRERHAVFEKYRVSVADQLVTFLSKRFRQQSEMWRAERKKQERGSEDRAKRFITGFGSIHQDLTPFVDLMRWLRQYSPERWESVRKAYCKEAVETRRRALGDFTAMIKLCSKESRSVPSLGSSRMDSFADAQIKPVLIFSPNAPLPAVSSFAGIHPINFLHFALAALCASCTAEQTFFNTFFALDLLPQQISPKSPHTPLSAAAGVAAAAMLTGGATPSAAQRTAPATSAAAAAGAVGSIGGQPPSPSVGMRGAPPTPATPAAAAAAAPAYGHPTTAPEFRYLILSELYPNAATEYTTLLDAASKADPFTMLPAILQVDRFLERYMEESPFLTHVLTDLLARAKSNLNALLDQLLASLDPKTDVRQAGILPPFRKFPSLLDRLGGLVGGEEDDNTRAAIVRLVTGLFEWLNRIASGNEKYKDIVCMENFHHFYVECSKRQQMKCIVPFVEEARSIFQASLAAYVRELVQYSLPTLYKYITMVDGHMNGGRPAGDVQFLHDCSKRDFINMLKANSVSAVKSALSQIYKRMQKHLSSTENLHQIVWSSLLTYMQQLLNHTLDIARQCYELSSVDPLPAARDLLPLFTAVRPLT